MMAAETAERADLNATAADEVATFAERAAEAAGAAATRARTSADSARAVAAESRGRHLRDVEELRDGSRTAETDARVAYEVEGGAHSPRRSAEPS